MSEQILIDISRSVEVVHIGDEFLIYITLTNQLEKPISAAGISYDLPKGFFIRGKQPETPASDRKPSGWLGAMVDALRDFLFIPSMPYTVFGSKRSMGWGVNILPGESYTIVMPVRAGAFLPPILAPNTYRLVFDVQYQCEDLQHTIQSKLDLLVFPHPGSVYVGSILGGTAGSFLRKPTWSENLLSDFLIGSLTGLVLSVVFRRKANVQAIIAVEDFWGGFLIGAIAGYGGQGILNTFLPTSGKGAS